MTQPAAQSKTSSKPSSAKKNAKAGSKTDKPPTVEESIQTLNEMFGEIYPEIEGLNTLLRKEGKGPKQDFKTSLLHEDDLRVEYRIAVTTAKGEPVLLEGDLTLHSLLAKELMTEAPTSFMQTVTANIMRPLQVRFQALIEARIRRAVPPARLPQKTPDETLPAPINESKPSGADPRKDQADPPKASGT